MLTLISYMDYYIWNIYVSFFMGGYLPLYEDTSAIDFEPDRSIRLAGHAPKVGHNELDLL